MNVLFFPPTHDSGLGLQYRETLSALRAQGVGITQADDSPLADTSDVMHLFDAPDAYTSLASFVQARALGKPIVVNPNYWNSDRFYDQGLPEADPPQGASAALEQQLRNARREAERAAQRVLFRHAATLIALSASEAEQMVRDFQVEPKRVAIAPLGISAHFATAEPDLFVQAYGLRDFVLCAARVEIRKNQWSLVRALRDEPLTLVFAGENLAPAYRLRCEQAAEGGRAKVVFLPSLPHDMLGSAYAAAKVHALASWYDCVALTPLEAAVARCSIALSSECGARDYLQDGAHTFDPARFDEISRAVRTAMDTPPPPELRERLLRDYTWERSAQETCNAYKRAQELGNPSTEDSYREDVEAALVAMAAYAQLQETARAELWREKAELANARDAYANGRVMRLMARLQRIMRGK